MGLQFIGEIGLFLPERNAIKITAIDGDRVIDCFVTSSALAAIGCRDRTDHAELVRHFQKHRDTIEIAAMVKYRRALAPTVQLDVGAEDVALIQPATAA